MTHGKILECSRWWVGDLTLLTGGACAFDQLNSYKSFSKKLNARGGGEGRLGMGGFGIDYYITES